VSIPRAAFRSKDLTVKKLRERHDKIIVTAHERNGPVNTSQYDKETRKNRKRDQRTPAYRDLQRRSTEERTQLETKLRERNAAIDRLTKKLVEAGVAAEEVAKLAA